MGLYILHIVSDFMILLTNILALSIITLLKYYVIPVEQMKFSILCGFHYHVIKTSNKRFGRHNKFMVETLHT